MCILNQEYQVKQRVNIYKKTVTQSQKVQIKVLIFRATFITEIISRST